MRAALERDDHEVTPRRFPSRSSSAKAACGARSSLPPARASRFTATSSRPSPGCRSLTAAAHKLAERLGGFGSDGERLELFLSLLLGLIERLIREAATGEGASGESARLPTAWLAARRLLRWVEAWEAIGRAKADAASLNLDRSLLVLETLFRLQQAARASGLANSLRALAEPRRRGYAMTAMADKHPYYITTAISYPNDAPHIGHAYEAVATDALARFRRLAGHATCSS